MKHEVLKKHDILISYSSRRSEIAEDFHLALKRAHFSVWMAPKSIPSGTEYPDVIYNALDHSEIIVFILCDESLQSEWCNNEIKYAIQQNKKIIPVQISNVDNPYDKMGKISRRLKWKQILVLFPYYAKRLKEVVKQCRELRKRKKENIVHPYPIDNYEILPTDECFVGREEEIQNLHALLVQKRIVNLYGLGGIGKTALVRKFFSEYSEKDAYHSIHIVPFKISLEETIASIPFAGFDEDAYLQSLKTFDSFSKTKEIYDKKLRLLQHLSSECLLVIDGADYLTEEEIVPLASIGCRVILTSRNVYDKFASMELTALTTSQLVELFYAYAHIEKREEDLPLLMDTISRVGYHTLMIKLLASYCNESHLTIKELCKEDILKSLNLYDDNNEKISTLFDFSKLSQKLSDQEIYTLKILSLFPNGITKGRLQALDKFVARTASLLSKKGFITQTDSIYFLHQIIQESVLAYFPMTTESLNPFLDCFIELFRKLDWEKSELLVVVRRMVSSISGNDVTMIRLWNRIGNYLGDTAYADMFHVSKETYQSQDMNFVNLKNDSKLSFDLYEESFRLNQKAWNLAREIHWDNHEEIAYIISYMGSAFFNQNQFSLALEYQLKAREYAEKNGVLETSTKYIAIINRLGLTALETNDLDIAEEAFCRYKDIVCAHAIPNGNLSMILFNLGNLFYKKGDLKKAEQYYLDSSKENKDDPSTSYGLSELWLCLASICLQENRKEEAEMYYLKARSIKEKIWVDEEIFKQFTNQYDKIYCLSK